MEKINAVITGVGGYVPDYVLTNEELSRMVDTTDEWIMTRIGVKERRILNEEGLGTSYMEHVLFSYSVAACYGDAPCVCRYLHAGCGADGVFGLCPAYLLRGTFRYGCPGRLPDGLCVFG